MVPANERFRQQLAFIIEIDKIKHIIRRTKLFDGSRLENDAEHSWHLAVLCLMLAEHANEPIDILRTVKMVLIHDVVEIDAGDTFIYDASLADAKAEKEQAAADRIFGLLPDDLRREYRALWEEFEERRTPEARFAACMDRFEPVLQNYLTNGYAYLKNGVPYEKVAAVNSKMADGSDAVWQYARAMIEELFGRTKLD